MLRQSSVATTYAPGLLARAGAGYRRRLLLAGLAVGLVSAGGVHPTALVPTAVLGSVLGGVPGWHMEQDR